MGVTAKLGGFVLLASSPVKWELKAGVKPHEAEFDMMPADATSLTTGPMKPVTLHIDDGNGRKVDIKNLYVLSLGVGENQYVHRVLVVDRRWFWGFTHVNRNINVRRNVGNKRQKNPDSAPEVNPLTPIIAYAPFSLLNKKPWTAKQVLESVLDQIMEVEKKTTGQAARFEILPEVGSLIKDLPIEDMNLDDPGDVALRRVLAYLPDASVVLDKNGTVTVKSPSDGTEQTVIDQLGAESVGLGHVQPILTHRIRPRTIEVLFTREHEVRFDFEESASPTTTEDQRYMDNVLPVPDYELTKKNGDTLCQGTWIGFPTAFNSWGAPPRQSALTTAGAWYAFTRRAMVPYMDLWTQCGQNGLRDPDADWMARLGAIQTYFRRVFRINPRWMARILQLKAEKKATIDPATGTRAPALAYADHARVGGMRSTKVYIAAGEEIPFVINVRSSPDSAGANFDHPPAPAEVSIEDHDQGIVALDFKPDVYRLHEMLLPSMVESDGEGKDGLGRPLKAGPTANIDDHKTAIAFNAISTTAKIPQLTAEHRVAVVLTAVPAGTNSKDMEQFEKITVTPAMVKKLLPASLARGIDNSVGPTLQLRVNPTLETARVAWVNSRSDDIEAAFGLGNAKANVTDLIVNLKGNVQGGASCQAIAEALAARTWALLTDRLQGRATARLSPETTPSGHIESVGHEVTPLGAVQTSITLPGQLEPIDMFSLMPESTRRLVLRMLPSPGKVAK